MRVQKEVKVLITSDGDCLRLTAVEFPVATKKRPAFPGLRQDRPDDKEYFPLFKTIAARCIVSMKSEFSDMRDRRSASVALVEDLQFYSFADAQIICCSALVGNRNAIATVTGEIEIVEGGNHSVVLVRGYLIDATVGQFGSPQEQIPDYLVLPERIATPMLEASRLWMKTKMNEAYMYAQKNGRYNYLIAYIPTDPEFAVK